jgi:hypothetical protein
MKQSNSKLESLVGIIGVLVLFSIVVIGGRLAVFFGTTKEVLSNRISLWAGVIVAFFILTKIILLVRK